MDSNAIEIIQQTAIDAQKANRLVTHTPAIVLHSGQSIESLERLQEHRSRFRGIYSTQSMLDFTAYAIARANGQGFIDVNAMTAVVFFDLMIGEPGAPQQAGHGEHVAKLQLPRTAAFDALMKACVAEHSQKDMAEFIEDWPENLAADYTDTERPENDPKFLTRAIAAVRNVKIKAVGESTHVEGDFNRSRSSLEDVEASSQHKLPPGFRFTGVPHEGLESITTYVRLGVLTDRDKPRFKLRLRAAATLLENIGQDFKSKLLAGIGDKATMQLGTFQLGK